MKKNKKTNHFIKALDGAWKYTILTPLAMIGEVAMEVLIPYIMGYLVDFLTIYGKYELDPDISLELLKAQFAESSANKVTLFYNAMHGGFNIIGLICLIGGMIVGTALLSLLFGTLGAKFGAKAGSLFARNLRKQIYDNIQTLSFENLDKYQTSSLITRLTTDVTSIQDAFVAVLRMFVRAPLMFVCSFIMCCRIKIQLSTILLVSIPLLLIGLFIIVSHAHPYFVKLFKTYDKLNERVQENLIGIRVVKSFVREDFEIEKFKKTNHEMKTIGTSAENVLIWNSPLMYTLMYGTTFFVCYLAAKLYIIPQNGVMTMTFGDLQAYIQYITQILGSLMMVSMMFVMVVMSKASVQRIKEILDEKAVLHNPENPIYDVENGDISFKNVNFSYSHNEDNLNLQNVNLDIKSGEIIGVIGGTGSSKTTLVSLISRLYDVTSGSVSVGDHDVREYDMSSLRDQVAVVLQKNVLFSGSIRDNMKWGKKDATDEEIIEALKNAQAYEFVSKLPNGLDYDLGQGGVNVSGGQKQRLCIARALLKKPKVLILDDSTSAVDTKTDALIREAFRTCIPDVTKIIIAQRINSVQDADKIIVLNEGKVDGFGTHEELIKNNEIYKEVFESQTKGDEE